VPRAGDVGLLLTELKASIDTGLLMGKGVPPGTQLEEVHVNGSRGFWIEGAPHLFLRDAGGSMRDAPARLAGNTLLWEQAGLTMRLESGLDRDAAIRTAQSMRATD
jgi:hypothetical protein